MGYGSDAALIRAPSGIDGDRAAWHARVSALYEELRPAAVALIRRAYGVALGDPEIEDIYSSAWLGTLRALERKQANLSDEDVRSYLLTSVANQARKELRRRRRKPVAPLEAAGSVPGDAASPEEEAQAAESRALTRDLLSSLPARRRAVLLLRYGWELAPDEVCGMVAGLSPRAYRREISKGVDELADRIRLVDEGRWCEEREPLLKAFASGLASEDEALQAERHISHCRSCSEFVGRLSGQLHDLGSAILLPGALTGAGGPHAVLERAKSALEAARDTAASPFSRVDPAEGITLATGARGAGAAGVSAFAKLSGLGAGAKAALACAGGAVAASVCVASGIAPISLPGPPDAGLEAGAKKSPPLARLDLEEVRTEDPGPEGPLTQKPEPGGASSRERAQDDVQATPEVPLAPGTPPVTQELGVESGAEPVGQPPPQTDAGSGSGAVAGEFGP
jgi:RNA polymerase sigma factor (sigma-70 family)